MSEEFRVGDVIVYVSERENRWCREGQAIVRDVDGGVVAFDTFWFGGGDQHRLTEGELATASVEFNLNEVRPVERGEVWADYNPADRFRVTHQHGLQSTGYVRLDAEPDIETRIDNCRTKVDEAHEELQHAKRRYEWAKEELANMRPGDTGTKNGDRHE